MRETNTRDYIQKLTALYPDLDEKGLSALVNFMFRKVYEMVKSGHEVHLHTRFPEPFMMKIVREQHNPKRANYHGRHLLKRRKKLQQKHAEMPKEKYIPRKDRPKKTKPNGSEEHL